MTFSVKNKQLIMFLKPPAEYQQSAQTLPPFSDIAGYALEGQNKHTHPPQ